MICSRKPRLTQPYKSITKVYYTAILRDSLVTTGVIPTTRAWLISLVILKGFSRTTTVMAPSSGYVQKMENPLWICGRNPRSTFRFLLQIFTLHTSFRCRFGHRLAPLNGATLCPGYPTGFTGQEITQYFIFFSKYALLEQQQQQQCRFLIEIKTTRI